MITDLLEYVFKILHRLERIEKKLTLLLTNQGTEMATIQDIKTEVENEKTVVDSAVALLNGLHQQLADAIAANDPAAVQAVLDQLQANKQALADAVAANTDAQP